MPRAKGIGGVGDIMMGVIIVVAFIFLLTTFIKEDATDPGTYEFKLPEQTEINKNIMTFMKLLIIGGGVLLFWMTTKKAGTSLSKRDAFTLVLIGVMAWFVWDAFLSDVFQMDKIGETAEKAAIKLGLAP